MKKLLLLLLVTLFFSGCEKDDICDAATPTTPKVVIEFYDSANPTVLKNVVNLGVIAPGFTNGIGFTNVSKITVPLKTFQDASVLNFIQNGSADPTSDDNSDEVTFNYTRKIEYVSRACGYKTLYTLDATNPIIVTADGNNWIQSVTVSQPNIENENETHVKIYF
jgi:acetaldehyde dehydrogenase (acetylating)